MGGKIAKQCVMKIEDGRQKEKVFTKGKRMQEENSGERKKQTKRMEKKGPQRPTN